MATQASAPTLTGEKASRVRYWVIVFAVALAVITYVDRVCISLAAPFISKDLNLSKLQMGKVFAAFTLAYSLFEIPGGYLGDWIGPRKVLMRIVIWWSFFTAATGWAWNFASLLVTRFMFGAGEAGVYPNLTKAFTTWLPHNERVRAQGIMWMSSRWGGAFTPSLVYLVFQVMSWRHSFELFGGIGILWAVAFYIWFRDNPRDKKSVNKAELELLAGSDELASGHGNVPWGKLVRSQQAWLLCAQYFCLSYPWYFYITWLPTYLKESRGLELGQNAVLSGLPLLFGGLGSLFCGFFSARLTQWTGDVGKTRRLMAYIGFPSAAALLVASLLIHNAIAAMVIMGLASFCNDLVMPGSWGACMDVGGKYAGTLSGAMNMMGNLGGVAAPIVTGYILEHSKTPWEITICVSATVYLIGTFFWMRLDPVTPFDREAAVHA
jgi:ACS family glucarate transporter-like MFS transporter